MAAYAAFGSSIRGRRVDVHMKGQDDRMLYFRMNENARLSKMFKIYCERWQLDLQTMQFSYEGNCINGEQTPLSLGLDDDAEICAFVHQFGGSRPISC